VAGMSDEDMLLAFERLVEAGGGLIAVADGSVLALVDLPIAGLMSTRPVAGGAGQTRRVAAAYRALGCEIEQPYLIFPFLSLAVLPALRLPNRGLVDTVNFELVPAVVQ